MRRRSCDGGEPRHPPTRRMRRATKNRWPKTHGSYRDDCHLSFNLARCVALTCDAPLTPVALEPWSFSTNVADSWSGAPSSAPPSLPYLAPRQIKCEAAICRATSRAKAPGQLLSDNDLRTVEAARPSRNLSFISFHCIHIIALRDEMI